MAYVEVDVDLSEFETSELVDELCDRISTQRKSKKMTPVQIKNLKDELSALIEDFDLKFDNELPKDKLVDTMKYEHIVEVFNKYTLEDFERLIPIR